MSIRLSGLYRYPVKSLRGEALETMAVDARGPRHDRHWMLASPEGRFLTQRELPRMALIRPEITPGGLILDAPGMAKQEVMTESRQDLPVQIWKDHCLARRVSPLADQWLSEFLGLEVILVYLPEERIRAVDPAYARSGDQTGFSDGFPFLLISQASLDDLNQRMGRTLPMERFRPNLVVEGCEAYAEDTWKRIRIG
ncbi:MOSC domain-containing protein, partial [Thiolapillus sp.]